LKHGILLNYRLFIEVREFCKKLTTPTTATTILVFIYNIIEGDLKNEI